MPTASATPASLDYTPVPQVNEAETAYPVSATATTYPLPPVDGITGTFAMPPAQASPNASLLLQSFAYVGTAPTAAPGSSSLRRLGFFAGNNQSWGSALRPTRDARHRFDVQGAIPCFPAAPLYKGVQTFREYSSCIETSDMGEPIQVMGGPGAQITLPTGTLCGIPPYYFGTSGASGNMEFDFQNPMVGMCPGILTYNGPETGDTGQVIDLVGASDPYIVEVIASSGPSQLSNATGNYFFAPGQTFSTYVYYTDKNGEEPCTITSLTSSEPIFSVSPNSGVCSTASKNGTLFTVTAGSLSNGAVAASGVLDVTGFLAGGPSMSGVVDGTYLYLEY